MNINTCLRCAKRCSGFYINGKPFERVNVWHRNGRYQIRAANISLWPSSKSTDWNKAVSEAEKIVGYPTSFMSLRCLLSDELSNVALQMRKLVGTKHPLLKTARKFFFDGKHSMQTRGLLILLISKAAGNPDDAEEPLDKLGTGIHQSQRSLAEITEMIYTASMIHKGVVNLESLTVSDGPVKDIEFGNKMAVLSGDFLLANASTGLADLSNTKVVEIVSSAIADMMEAEFISTKDDNGHNIIPINGVSLEDWEKQIYLGEGSLLAKSCKSAMLLGSHSEVSQREAFEFGKHITFARQAREDLLPFTKTFEENGNNVSVTSLPVVLQLQRKPSLLRNIGEINKMTSHDILKLVDDHAVLEETKTVCFNYGQKALKAIQFFPKSEARIALENIVKAVVTL